MTSAIIRQLATLRSTSRLRMMVYSLVVTNVTLDQHLGLVYYIIKEVSMKELYIPANIVISGQRIKVA